MKLKDVILTASANMRRSKLRTALTIIAIFIGAFTLTLTNGLGAGISSYVDKQVANLGQADAITIMAKTETSQTSTSDEPQKYVEGETTAAAGFGGGAPGMSSGSLTQKDIDKLKAYGQITDVQASFAVSPDYIKGAGDDRYKASVSAVGGSTNLDLAAGSQLTNDGDKKEVTIPLNYVSVLGYGSDADAIGKTVTLGITDATGVQHTVTATIAAVQQKGLVSSSGIVANTALKNELYDLQTTGLPEASKNKYQSASAKITGDLADGHIQTVKNELSDMGYSATTLNDQLGLFKTIISSLTYILNAFAIIALLAAGFGIINTLLMSVQERTKEIGLMKAMGMRSSRIFLLFSFEAVLIGFWGSALGVAIAMGVGTVANAVASNTLLKDLPGFNLLAFPLSSIIGIILLIMVIAFLAGTLPARKAARQNPIDALRYE